MILRQYREFVEGKKTETRRLVGDHWLQVFFEYGFEFYSGLLLTDYKAELIGKGDLQRVSSASRRTLYEAGQDYPLIPKRGQKRLLVQEKPFGWVYSTDDLMGSGPIVNAWAKESPDHWLEHMKLAGWQEVRVKVEKMEVERLHEIAEEGAKREGITKPGFRFQRWPDGKVEGRDCYVAAYEELWDSIHTAKKARFWATNPFVVVMRIKPEFR